jgi:4-hydroxy-4-methyl-2-oxoglutarate aldolase
VPIQRYKPKYERLSPADLEGWKKVPPAIASDCMNRGQFMAAAIKPLAPGMRLTGQARTVTSMVGDNGIHHVATQLLNPGEILVIDAKGFTDIAVWGGVTTRAAIAKGAGGIVIDGAVRDAAEIRELGFPCFVRAVVPSGPHKGFGGTIDGAISCAGCPVSPGDIVLGDDDGVAVVPIARWRAVYQDCLKKLAQEEDWLRQLDKGETMVKILNLPAAEIVSD